MSVYETLKQEYAQADPEQKLKILRHELLQPILTVQNVAALLKQIDADLVKDLPQNVSPQEFEQLLKWLAEAGVDLQHIVDALTPDERLK